MLRPGPEYILQRFLMHDSQIGDSEAGGRCALSFALGERLVADLERAVAVGLEFPDRVEVEGGGGWKCVPTSTASGRPRYPRRLTPMRHFLNSSARMSPWILRVTLAV